MMEGLFYDIMVWISEGWNERLYDNLNFKHLVECAKDGLIDEWNEAYEEYLKSEWERLFPDTVYNLNNIQQLIAADFVRPDYNKKRFKKAILEGAEFSSLHLEGANFSYANLEDGYFWDTYLAGSDFTGSHLENASFSYAHLEGADFTLAYLNDAVFENAQLKDAMFNGSYLRHANFYLGRLQGTYFIYSDLKGARLNLAVVNGETLFSNTIIDDKTDFTGTNLSVVRIDPKLRKHLERNIRKLNITNKNVFVAMKFDSPDIESALKNAIKPACLECGGLEAFTVNEKAGDGWIPQTIREGIQDARFVISDLTYRNHGVYYETCYADGLEIPVIQTCNRSWFNSEKDEKQSPLHFDIAQRYTILWDDDNDLKQQLILKIKELQANGK